MQPPATANIFAGENNPIYTAAERIIIVDQRSAAFTATTTIPPGVACAGNQILVSGPDGIDFRAPDDSNHLRVMFLMKNGTCAYLRCKIVFSTSPSMYTISESGKTTSGFKLSVSDSMPLPIKWCPGKKDSKLVYAQTTAAMHVIKDTLAVERHDQAESISMQQQPKAGINNGGISVDDIDTFFSVTFAGVTYHFSSLIPAWRGSSDDRKMVLFTHFLEIMGFFIGDGSIGHRVVKFNQNKKRDIGWLEKRFQAFGFQKLDRAAAAANSTGRRRLQRVNTGYTITVSGDKTCLGVLSDAWSNYFCALTPTCDKYPHVQRWRRDELERWAEQARDATKEARLAQAKRAAQAAAGVVNDDGEEPEQYIASAKPLPPWWPRLSPKLCEHLMLGINEADGTSSKNCAVGRSKTLYVIYTSSDKSRDEYMALFVHIGFSAATHVHNYKGETQYIGGREVTTTATNWVVSGSRGSRSLGGALASFRPRTDVTKDEGERQRIFNVVPLERQDEVVGFAMRSTPIAPIVMPLKETERNLGRRMQGRVIFVGPGIEDPAAKRAREDREKTDVTATGGGFTDCGASGYQFDYRGAVGGFTNRGASGYQFDYRGAVGGFADTRRRQRDVPDFE